MMDYGLLFVQFYGKSIGGELLLLHPHKILDIFCAMVCYGINKLFLSMAGKLHLVDCVQVKCCVFLPTVALLFYTLFSLWCA